MTETELNTCNSNIDCNVDLDVAGQRRIHWSTSYCHFPHSFMPHIHSTQPRAGCLVHSQLGPAAAEAIVLTSSIFSELDVKPPAKSYTFHPFDFWSKSIYLFRWPLIRCRCKESKSRKLRKRCQEQRRRNKQWTQWEHGICSATVRLTILKVLTAIDKINVNYLQHQLTAAAGNLLVTWVVG